MPRDQVFICYSHSDYTTPFLERLNKHLQRSRKEGIEIWSDESIKEGQRWSDEIAKALKRAKVAILLLNADFFDSKFISDVELPTLLQAAQDDGAVILPIVLYECDFENSRLGVFQAFNNAVPLATLEKHDQEKVYGNVVRRINEIFARNSRP